MAKFIFRKKIKENPPEKEDNPVKEKKSREVETGKG